MELMTEPLSHRLDFEPVLQEIKERENTAVNVGHDERVMSVIGGSLLTAYGLMRRSPMGALLALIGAATLYRGVTGHCDLYQKMGRSS